MQWEIEQSNLFNLIFTTKVRLAYLFSFLFQLTVLSIISPSLAKLSQECQGGGGLKYLWGDAMTDSPDCKGPNNMAYPT